MSDIYLLVTPALTLLIVALVGFVGCDALFGIDHVDYDPPIPPRNLQLTPDNMRIDLSWDAPTGGNPTGYRVEKGMSPGDRPVKVDVGLTTSYSDTDVINGMMYCYAVTSLVGTDLRGTSEEMCATAGYTGLNSLVTQVIPGTLRNNFMANVGMGFRVGPAPIQVSRLGRYKLPGNSGAHTLKLVNGATQTDMPGGSVTINLAGAPDNQFAYGDLPAPITLMADSDYYVVSSETDMGDQWYDSADTRIMTTNVVTRVFAVNEDSPGHFNVAPTPAFVYGPLDIQY